jgi:putative oxidoreductase
MKMKDLPSWSQNHFEYFLDAVRVYLGLGLIIKGISFATNPHYFAATFNGVAFDSLLPIVPYIHIFGGVFLAAGVFTRIAAIIQIPILFTATFLVHLPQMETIRGRESIEFSALVLFLLVLIAIKGPGPLSLGRYWRKEPPVEHTWIADHADVFADLIRMYLGVGLFLKGLYIMEHREAFSRL